ncbi:MAG TPA: hypothetical protein DCE23_04680 [Firmicutes bacterium]|nr:hypothetical protein [Bacillota bacterium]
MKNEMSSNTKKRSKKKIILIIVLSLIFIWMICFCVDWYCMKKNDKPAFVFLDNYYLDTGTIVYYSLGYKWIKYHAFPSSSKDYSSSFCDGIAVKPLFVDDFAGSECE